MADLQLIAETEKVFDATIDIANPIGFCTDKERHLMNELHNQFVDRCYKGALVLRIVRVIKSGACCICTSNGSGEGSVDVQFLAAVRVFSRWDILTGVTVRHVSHLIAGHYTPPGGSAQAFVVLRPTRGADTLSEGQQIAVRITNAEHPARQAAVAYGVLLTCDRAAPVYRVRGALEPAAAADLLPMVDQIATELALREDVARTHGAALLFFETLLYSYAAPAGASAAASAAALSHRVAAWEGGPEWVGPVPLCGPDDAAFTMLSIVDLVRRAAAGTAVPVAGLWSRPLCLHRSSPLAAFAPRAVNAARSEARSEAPESVDEPPRVMFALMLKNILDFLMATREMATGYVRPDSDPKYAGLWSAMRMAQLPLP